MCPHSAPQREAPKTEAEPRRGQSTNPRDPKQRDQAGVCRLLPGSEEDLAPKQKERKIPLKTLCVKNTFLAAHGSGQGGHRRLSGTPVPGPLGQLGRRQHEASKGLEEGGRPGAGNSCWLAAGSPGQRCVCTTPLHSNSATPSSEGQTRIPSGSPETQPGPRSGTCPSHHLPPAHQTRRSCDPVGLCKLGSHLPWAL